MKWFRFYSEVLESKKVQDLSPLLFKFWINLLALANNETPRGSLPDVEEVAFRLRLPVKRVSDDMVVMVAKGLIDAESDTIRMHNWDTWQKASDDAAERMFRANELVVSDMVWEIVDEEFGAPMPVDGRSMSGAMTRAAGRGPGRLE